MMAEVDKLNNKISSIPLDVSVIKINARTTSYCVEEKDHAFEFEQVI